MGDEEYKDKRQKEKDKSFKFRIPRLVGGKGWILDLKNKNCHLNII